MTKTEPTAAPMDGNVEAERAAIVAWLLTGGPFWNSDINENGGLWTARQFAEAIANGDHNGEGK